MNQTVTDDDMVRMAIRCGTMTDFDDYRALVESSPRDELELRHTVGNHEFSPDLMVKAAGRPPIGVQGVILDGMDDGRLTVKEASTLLAMVQKRLREEATDGR